MNDLRFPGLRSPLPAVTRADAVLPAQGARGAAAESDAGDDQRARFDRSLQRSVEADRSTERRQATRESTESTERTRRAARESAQETARESARETTRQPQRPVERAVDRSTERAQAQSQQARREQNSAMNRSTPDRTTAARPDDTAPAAARSGAPADAAARSGTGAVDADAAAAADSTAVPTAVQPPIAPPAAERPDATAALVAASAALTAAARAPADAAATDTPTDAPLTDDAQTFDALPGTAATAARGKAARAAADEALEPGARSGRAAIPELSAELTRTPAKDRLLEDFERRFENSLARAVGAGIGGGSPLTTTSPLLAAGLPQQLAPTPGASAAAVAAVPTPLGHPAFGEDLSQRVMLFAGQRVQSAELTVTPADMGPISVSIEVRGQEAAMQFAASHATTRAAIEDALPRLREMLAAQGLQLTQADVGDRAPRDPQGGVGGQGGQSGQGSSGSGPWSGGSHGARGAQAAAEPVVRRLGLIDIRV